MCDDDAKASAAVEPCPRSSAIAAAVPLTNNYLKKIEAGGVVKRWMVNEEKGINERASVCVHTVAFTTDARTHTHSPRFVRLFLSPCGLGCAVSQPTLSPLTLALAPWSVQ